MSKGEIATQTMALRTPKGAVQPTFRVAVVAGPDVGKELVVDGASPAKVFVGTGPTSHARLADPTVSRRHLALSLRDGALGVEDLGSTNGTFLGAARVKEIALAGGEELALGSTRLRIARLDAGAVLTLAREAGFGRLVGASVAMRRLYPLLRRLADADVPVLVEGEPGTGKELLAEVLHEEGPRREGPFVVLEAGTSDESRLFGVVDQARGGTLVIDEPSELAGSLQATLARLLEGRAVPREAATQVSLVGVRVLALSRVDVEREAQAGRLREDLAMALSAALVSLPPLREREGDVALLATTFMRAQGAHDRVIPPLTMRRFEAYAWPGNVRELMRAVVRFATTGDDATDAVLAFREDARAATPSELVDRVLAADLPLAQARDIVVEDFERRFVRVVLERHGGNVTRAAAASGVARRYFQLLRAKRS